MCTYQIGLQLMTCRFHSFFHSCTDHIRLQLMICVDFILMNTQIFYKELHHRMYNSLQSNLVCLMLEMTGKFLFLLIYFVYVHVQAMGKQMVRLGSIAQLDNPSRRDNSDTNPDRSWFLIFGWHPIQGNGTLTTIPLALQVEHKTNHFVS